MCARTHARTHARAPHTHSELFQGNIYVCLQSEVYNCTDSYKFSIFHTKRGHLPLLIGRNEIYNCLTWVFDFPREGRSTPTPVYGTKQGLTYKNCFVNNFLTNNKYRKKLIILIFLKIKVNINIESHLELAVSNFIKFTIKITLKL